MVPKDQLHLVAVLEKHLLIDVPVNSFDGLLFRVGSVAFQCCLDDARIEHIVVSLGLLRGKQS